MRLQVIGTLASLVCLANPALAQSPAARFADMRLETDQIVTVTTQGGTEIRGRVSKTDGGTLTLRADDNSYEISEADTRHIDRDGDPVWEGLAIGLAMGGGLGLIGALSCSECGGSGGAAGALAFAGIGTGVGALIDLLIPGKTRVFQAPTSGASRVRLVPFVAANRHGMLVRIGL